MPTPHGCYYKQECTKEVTHDEFVSMCQSETNQFIYCEEFKDIENPKKYPREWDEA